MIIVRPIHKGEQCLLVGRTGHQLLITDIEDNKLEVINPPVGGWTYDSLEGVDFSEIAPHGWDAYLLDGADKYWIGSSEC